MDYYSVGKYVNPPWDKLGSAYARHCWYPRLCVGCGKPYGIRWRCDDCRKTQRNTYNKNRPKDYKDKARYLTRKMVMKGIITKNLKCDHCGGEAKHKHHEDYNDPMKIVWLCPKCHGAEHRNIRSKKLSDKTQNAKDAKQRAIDFYRRLH